MQSFTNASTVSQSKPASPAPSLSISQAKPASPTYDAGVQANYRQKMAARDQILKSS